MMMLCLYLSTLTTFLVVDIVWLKLVIGPMFQRHVADLLLDDPKLGIAAVFYALYVAGILYFVSLPAVARGGYMAPAMDAFLLGLLAYGTYEATNMATLKGWSMSMVISDTLWGGFLTMTSALAGLWVVRAAGLADA